MKRDLLLLIIITLGIGGCSSDDVIDQSIAEKAGNDSIGFSVSIANLTRSGSEGLQGSHYEFGVFAGVSSGSTQYASSSSMVMQNYLVAYGENGLYTSLHPTDGTYGDQEPSDGTGTTDERNKFSSWFYTGLNTTSGKTDYTTPQYSQVMKYWLRSYPTTYFYAYTPYNASNTYASAATIETLTLNDLSIFYTSPEDGYQVSTANTEAADATKTTALYEGSTYDKEMINYNEALYAYTPIAKANYGYDVPLNFRHLNAKVQLKFYTDITTGTVAITDMVPTAITAQEGVNKYSIAAAKGIQLTPATSAQTEYKKADDTYTAQVAENKLPKYDQKATITLTDMHYKTLTTRKSGTSINDNLVFKAPTDAVPTSKDAAVASPTIFYALPYDITGIERGYTLHLSYKITLGNGTETQYYDARVFIADEPTNWEAGKMYTYIFKITSDSQATIDPGNEEDKANTNQPWVDPRDPRLPDTQYLPIVLDGVEVSDNYNDGGTHYEE